jgi:hypothetical protein
MSAWAPQGSVSLVPDPDGDLGKSVRMAPRSTFSHNLGVSGPFRFNARIWIASRTSDNFPWVRVGHTAAAVFSKLSQYRVAEWQILEVLVSGDNAAATLHGDYVHFHLLVALVALPRLQYLHLSKPPYMLMIYLPLHYNGRICQAATMQYEVTKTLPFFFFFLLSRGTRSVILHSMLPRILLQQTLSAGYRLLVHVSNTNRCHQSNYLCNHRFSFPCKRCI